MKTMNTLHNFGKHLLPVKRPLIFPTSFFEAIKTKRTDKNFRQPVVFEETHRKPSSSQASRFFDSFDKIYGVNGYHVLNGGEHRIKELGYRLDYFNPELGVIIEWDEEHHYIKNRLRIKDIIRQRRIQDYYPSFIFIRIREKKFFEPKYIKGILDLLSEIVMRDKHNQQKEQKEQKEHKEPTYKNYLRKEFDAQYHKKSFKERNKFLMMLLNKSKEKRASK